MTSHIYFGVSGEKIGEGSRVGNVKDSVSYRLWDGYKFVSGSYEQVGFKANPEDVVTLFCDPSSGVRVLHNNSVFLLSSAALQAPCFTLTTVGQDSQVEIVDL